MKINPAIFTLITITLFAIDIHAQNNDLPFSPQKNRQQMTFNTDLTFSVGFGTSYGGYGGKINYLIFSDNKVGVQFGAGYYFGDILYSAALKLFIWKKLYFDFKYGRFGRHFELNYDTDYNVLEVARFLTGPGLIIGYEYYPFKNIGLNAGAGLNYDAKKESGLLFSYDIGIIFKI